MKIYSIEFFYKNILSMENIKSIDDIKIDKNYKHYSIPKKNGTRTISYLEKTESLYKIQNDITNKLFSDEPIPICVKGFVKHESYRNYLLPHVGNNYFLRVDIEDFFGSTNNEHVIKMLESIVLISNKKEKEKLISFLSDALTLNDCLPQGACSSPIVSNLCFRNIDQRITKYCQKLNIKYTRYADDLLFSSYDFNFKEKKWFLKQIRNILRSNQYKLNYSKIKYGEKELNINGFVIDNFCIRVSRKRCSDIKRVLYTIKENKKVYKENPDKFLEIINSIELNYKNSFETISNLIQYINGYRSFLISWLDFWNKDTNNQKELLRLIRKCQYCINIIQ